MIHKDRLRPNRHRLFVLGAAVLVAPMGSAGAGRAGSSLPPSPPLQGAEVVLQILAKGAETERKSDTVPSVQQSEPSNAEPLNKEQQAILNGARAFQKEIAIYDRQSAYLPPTTSAQRWLALVDRYHVLRPKLNLLPNTVYSSSGAATALQPVTFADLLKRLPPGAWKSLQSLILARPVPAVTVPTGRMDAKIQVIALREQSLRLLAHTLVNDEAGQWEALGAINRRLTMTPATKGKARQDASDLSAMRASLPALLDYLLAQTADPARMKQGLVMRLALWRTEKAMASRESPRVENIQPLTIPDLVPVVGKEKGEAILKPLLLQPDLPLILAQGGKETERLARRIALDNMALLPRKEAFWRLVSGFDAESVALYEALNRRFPLSAAPSRKPDDGLYVYDPRTEAQSHYLAGLVADGRVQEAVALSSRWKRSDDPFGPPYNRLRELQWKGYAQPLYDFLKVVAQRRPSAAVWDVLIPLGADVGRSAEVLALVRARAAAKNVTLSEQIELQDELVKALLAGDRVDEGVAGLRRVIALSRDRIDQARRSQKKGGTAEGRWDRDPAETGLWKLREYANQLVNLGKVLNRPDLVAAGIAEMHDLTLKAVGDSERRILTSYYTEMLVKNGRAAEAERILLDDLRVAGRRQAHQRQRAVSRQQDRMYGGADSFDYEAAVRADLISLLALYGAVGRPGDVVALLDRAPHWGASDLRALLTEQANEMSLGYVAARALAAKGRTREAVSILTALVKAEPGSDPSYALLLEVNGAAASLPLLDAVFATDRFEERPLIWKAEALRRLKRYGEAEQAARVAIAIDPSDGDEPHNDRMRVYAVLAEIRAARGDSNEARFLREVVRAIRIAEHGDDFIHAGLISQGTRLYQQALTHFTDAYCIQSRLAVNLAEQGRFEEAAAHYRKAYELMPDSFGRMESHCFGCEGAFTSRDGQRIAEEVFQRLAREKPDKPQIPYLLGYLRSAQGRNVEALNDFRNATRIDPDYINAWKKIDETARETWVSPPDRDAAVLNLLRLDPLQRHDSFVLELSLRSVHDVAALYQVVKSVQPFLRAQDAEARTSVFRLRASAARRSALGQDTPTPPADDEETGNGVPRSPGKAVIAQEAVAAISQTIDALDNVDDLSPHVAVVSQR